MIGRRDVDTYGVVEPCEVGRETGATRLAARRRENADDAMGEKHKRLSQQIIRVSYACHWLWLKMGWRVLGYPGLSLRRYSCVVCGVERIRANVLRVSSNVIARIKRGK